MKILIIRTYPDKLNLNAYNVQELGLAGALRRAGHECDIVFYNGFHPTIVEEREDGVRLYWVKSLNVAKNGVFFGLRKIAEQYDVLQVHEYDQLMSWLIYTFYRRKPVVLYHGPYYDSFNRGYNAKCAVFDKLFLPFSRRAQKAMYCMTKSPQAEEFLHGKGFGKVQTVGVGLAERRFDSAPSDTHSGVMADMPVDSSGIRVCTAADHSTADASAQAARSDIGVREPAEEKGMVFHHILYVGKLEERRNSVFLLQVMKKLLEKRDDIFCTVIGNGEESYVNSLMPQMDLLKKGGRFQWIRKASQDELAPLYREAEIMLFPSNYEIFGMVLLEAMYCGVVVISTENGGASCLIRNGENGLIENSLDVHAWVSKAIALLEDKERRNLMQKAASDTIRNSFTWDRIADQFVKVYQESLSVDNN